MNRDMHEVPQKILTEIKNKWILFDTDVLIEASAKPEAFNPLMSALEQARCVPTYFSSLSISIR